MPALLTLSACAGLTPPTAPVTALPSPSPAVAAALGSVRPYQDNIAISGRLSMRYQQNQSEEAVYGSFVWVQSPERTQLSLRSPLGQTVASIEVTPTLATLTQSGKPPQTASDVDSLVTNALGWPLPIAGLRWWLQGYTGQGGARAAVDAASASPVQSSDGWTIAYPDWQTQGGPVHPKRIDLQRHTRQAGDVAVRIVIDEWQAGSAAVSSATP
ncbi:MAG: lipoprotein insertase outer membrane protein LolB [Janthinobacterium lividum]